MKIACPKCHAAVTPDQSLLDLEVICPNCNFKIDLVQLMSFDGGVSQTRTQASGITESLLGQEIGQFRLDKVLGSGGFGCVFKAYDSRLDRNVALKLPKMSMLGSKQAKIFVHEAQAAAQLQHPNIVSVHEIGRVDGQVYIVSELINGETLKDWTQTEFPNPKRTATIIAKISRALHEAHLCGVIHRDMKPHNVLIDDHDDPHVTDFGLAKRDDTNENTITRRGSIMGTPAYMSPEQALGRADEADGRTDVYSLGVMLYEMLVGKRPYRGEMDSITDEIILGGAEPPKALNPKVNADISAICMKAMARKRGDRFSTALEMAEDLERFVQGLPVESRPLEPLEFITRHARRQLIPIAFTVALIAAICLWVFKSTVPHAADKKVLISFNVVPPRADVTIAKVDQKLGRVDTENLIYPEYISDEKGFEVNLAPGFYVVEASMPGMGVQEVRRTVPVEAFPQQGDNYSHDYFQIITPQHYRWKDIEISGIPARDLDGRIEQSGLEFELIKGGVFDGTAMQRKNESVEVADFLLGTSEITAQQFLKHMTKLPSGMVEEYESLGVKKADIPGSAVVTHVPYLQILAFCERTNTRPVLFDEYLFVATNGGETVFPWGDEPLDDWIANWGRGSKFEGQNVKRYPTIKGVYCGMLEWTQEFEAFSRPDGETTVRSFAGRYENTRIVADGPPELAKSLFNERKQVLGPRIFSNLQAISQYPYVGFRCAKSIQPRFKTKSEIEKAK